MAVTSYPLGTTFRYFSVNNSILRVSYISGGNLTIKNYDLRNGCWLSLDAGGTNFIVDDSATAPDSTYIEQHRSASSCDIYFTPSQIIIGTGDVRGVIPYEEIQVCVISNTFNVYIKYVSGIFYVWVKKDSMTGAANTAGYTDYAMLPYNIN